MLKAGGVFNLKAFIHESWTITPHVHNAYHMRARAHTLVPVTVHAGCAAAGQCPPVLPTMTQSWAGGAGDGDLRSGRGCSRALS